MTVEMKGEFSKEIEAARVELFLEINSVIAGLMLKTPNYQSVVNALRGCHAALLIICLWLSP